MENWERQITIVSFRESDHPIIHFTLPKRIAIYPTDTVAMTQIVFFGHKRF